MVPYYPFDTLISQNFWWFYFFCLGRNIATFYHQNCSLELKWKSLLFQIIFYGFPDTFVWIKYIKNIKLVLTLNSAANNKTSKTQIKHLQTENLMKCNELSFNGLFEHPHLRLFKKENLRKTFPCNIFILQKSILLKRTIVKRNNVFSKLILTLIKVAITLNCLNIFIHVLITRMFTQHYPPEIKKYIFL